MSERGKPIENPDYHTQVAKSQKFTRGLDEYDFLHDTDLLKEAKELALKLKKEDKLDGNTFHLLDVGGGLGVALKTLEKDLQKELEPHNIRVNALNLNLFDYSRAEGAPKHVMYDVQDLPKAWTNKWHFIVSTLVSQYVPDKLRMFEEVHRVLHPDGKARITFMKHQIQGVSEEELQEHEGVEVLTPSFKPDPGLIVVIKKNYLKEESRNLYMHDKGSSVLHYPFELDHHEADAKVPKEKRYSGFRVAHYRRK